MSDDVVEPVIDEAVDAAGDEPVEELEVDLDGIADDLADVEIALARLENGTYWTDEVTGAELPDAFLERFPTARRSPAG